VKSVKRNEIIAPTLTYCLVTLLILVLEPWNLMFWNPQTMDKCVMISSRWLNVQGLNESYTNMSVYRFCIKFNISFNMKNCWNNHQNGRISHFLFFHSVHHSVVTIRPKYQVFKSTSFRAPSVQSQFTPLESKFRFLRESDISCFWSLRRFSWQFKMSNSLANVQHWNWDFNNLKLLKLYKTFSSLSVEKLIVCDKVA
jgi:hypothetical protein